MSTLHHLLPRWTSRWHDARDSLLSSGPASGLSSCLQSRVEVCPPALWPSSLTLWGRARRWLDRSAWMPEDQRPVNRLALVKNEFRISLDDLRSSAASMLDERIDRARSLRELWHLRATLYGLLATEFNQIEAERRLARLNRHFPRRAPRAAVPAPTH